MHNNNSNNNINGCLNTDVKFAGTSAARHEERRNPDEETKT